MKRASPGVHGRGTPTWESVLLAVVSSADPAAALRRAGRNMRLPAAVRRAFAGASADGVRIAALLVAKLRFERLVRGSAEIDAAFERDPRGFTEAFRRYHAEVPLTAFDPLAEVQAFAAWRTRSAAGRARTAAQGRSASIARKAAPSTASGPSLDTEGGIGRSGTTPRSDSSPLGRTK